MNTTVETWLAVTATAAIVLAALCLLVGPLSSGGFAGRVPGGNQAVGLVVLLAASVVGALLLLLATGLTAALGRLDGADFGGRWPWLLLALGAGVATVVILLAWMERLGGWVAPLGWFCGVLAPLLLATVLLLGLWGKAEGISPSLLPGLRALLSVNAVAGLLVLAALLANWLRFQQENAARAEVAQQIEQTERERRHGLSAVERLREDYASYSPDTPLWVYIAGLPDTSDAEERSLSIEHALKVPSFLADLERTITDRYPRYRHGAIELIRWVDASRLDRRWIPALARSIQLSVAAIASEPNWLLGDESANPAPFEHLRAMQHAAARLGPDPQLSAALAQLQSAISDLPASPLRTQALAALASD